MNESRLVLFKLGQEKRILERHFRHCGSCASPRDVVRWYFLPHGCSGDFAREGFAIRKVAATNQNVPFAC
jgi:hypothetical protein